MSKKLAKLSRSSLDQLRDDIDTLDDFRKGLDQRLGTKGRWGIGLSWRFYPLVNIQKTMENHHW